MQYARMAVETVAPSCESSQRTAVDKGTIWEQLTRSLRQRVSILVYGIEAVGIHRVTLPHILDIDGQSSSALLTSPTYVASSSDPERTHRIKLLSIGGPSKRIIGWHADRFRRGYEPFATFNFDYRDSNLLKQLDLPVSANKCVDLLQATKRTYDAFLEDRNDARSCQPARKAVKLEDSLGRLSPVTGSLYEEQDSRLHDGYGPGSYYRARESRPRRSTGANIIPVASCHTSIVPHLSLDHEESLRRDSHSPLTKVMPTGPTASAAFNRVDQRITHLPSINTLSGQGDPRRVKQPQSLLNTPRSPPAHAVGTQTIAFQAMSQELYEARISLVAMPMEFVKMNAANRKIMPIALLRIKEKEDEKEEQRDWERSETPSGRFH